MSRSRLLCRGGSCLMLTSCATRSSIIFGSNGALVRNAVPSRFSPEMLIRSSAMVTRATLSERTSRRNSE